MARRPKSVGAKTPKVGDYRHESATRKNNPPAKIAAEGTVPVVPKAQYAYSPRRPPALRFDPRGGPDTLPELLDKATREPLTRDEARLLAEALRAHEPWLEWATKAEKKWFEVDPVALHIHERISAQAILKVAARQDVERMLFGDPEQAYHEAVQFYRYDIDWTNRLILGDSLQVMSSLARREDLAGKVQMIYIDPPYGIKFASNFQPEVGRRDVKDKEQDLTREPEMVKAYRDTWHLGVHSYLSYLRDRLIVARELLADTGSIFVQISDENVHRIRALLDEIFGITCFVSEIAFVTTGGRSATLLSNVFDRILWYAKDTEKVRFRQLFVERELRAGGGWAHSRIERTDGIRENIGVDSVRAMVSSGQPVRPYMMDQIVSQGATATGSGPFVLDGHEYRPPPNSHWKTSTLGMERLARASRIEASENSIRYVRFFDDFAVQPVANVWDDTNRAGYMDEKRYVVQTAGKVIERCMLMTTDPGDLVLDPTCGSGTTAYVAEQWGRRWISIDTSRVAIAIARQRLLTARFDRYRVKGEDPGGNGHGNHRPGVDPHPGFEYKKVPHITLKSIAQNTNLDPIFARHEPILDKKLAACNSALAKATDDLRWKLVRKLQAKQQAEGKKSITDADRRRWELPKSRGLQPARSPETEGVSAAPVGFEHWTVPFDTDPDWPAPLQEAVTEYRKAWRAKMDEVNACITANAEPEELVDQPDVVKGVVRVSGPFTVEAVQPPELSLSENIDPHTSGTSPDPSLARRGGKEGVPARSAGAGALPPVSASGEGLFDGEPESLADGFEPRTLRMVEPRTDLEAKNVEAYLEQMVRLLRTDGVRFPNNKQMTFTRLERLQAVTPGLHAEGRWVPTNGGKSAAGKGEPTPLVPPSSRGEVKGLDSDPEGKATVAVAVGPQYGPVTAKMVEDCIRSANRMGYEDLIVAGFSFDGPAQAVIEEMKEYKLRVHAAHIRPDVNPGMEGLLKEQPGSQLFTVFGQPRTRVDGPDADGEYAVTMEGVDIYNPVDNSINPTGAEKVAAWFIDGDYDGWTFCITQAFFPDRAAWDKLTKALTGVVDPDRFEALSGTVSLPFPAGKHRCVAVKVIDPRGNEVMRVHRV
jgi:adenine-specific DNA-methyltransferase